MIKPGIFSQSQKTHAFRIQNTYLCAFLNAKTLKENAPLTNVPCQQNHYSGTANGKTPKKNDPTVGGKQNQPA